MDIQVGDRVIYKSGNVERQVIITNEEQLDNYKKSNLILKTERPSYEVVEEKKELLTDEERAFLKLYIKFSNKIIDGIKKDDGILNFMQDIEEDNFIELVDDFKNLKEGKLYTLSELGLES